MFKQKWFIVGSITLPIVMIALVNGAQPFDDAFITYRYARNLANGLGFVYNSSQPVLGTTTPLYTLLLAGLGKFTRIEAIPLFSFMIGVIADIVSGIVLFRITQRQLGAWPAWGVTLAWIFNPLRIAVSVGGMETELFVMCLILMYDFYLRDVPSYWAVGFAALAFLTRPDAALAIAPVGFDWLRRFPKHAVRAALLGALYIAPWLLWSTYYFGSPLPHSILAKSTAYLEAPLQGLSGILVFLGTGTIGDYHLGVPLFVGIGLAGGMYAFGLAQIIRQHLLLWVVAVYPLIYMLVMSLARAPLAFGWYFPPLIPAGLLTIIGGCWLWSKRSLKTRRSLVALAGLVSVLMPFFYQTALPSWVLTRESMPSYWTACAFSRDRIQPGQTVMAFDIGVLGYCLPQARILDVIGLVSPEALPYLRAGASTIFDPRLIEDYHPSYIIAMEQWISPLLRDGSLFQHYRSIWQKPVTVTHVTQTLYILERRDLSDP